MVNLETFDEGLYERMDLWKRSINTTGNDGSMIGKEQLSQPTADHIDTWCSQPWRCPSKPPSRDC